MKNILIVLLFLTVNTFSQGLFNSYEKGKVLLRNNTEVFGLVKVSGKKIKFKKSKDDEKIVYTSKDARKVIFDTGIEYHYKIKNEVTLLLKNEVRGKLNLYSTTGTSAPMMSPNGMMMGGGMPYTIYYINKKNSDLIVKLPANEKGKKYRKLIAKYVSDCNGFSKYIKDKKAIKKNFNNNSNSISVNLIEFYNQVCSNIKQTTSKK